MPTPLGSDNVAVAAALGMEVTEYVFGYHAIVSIPTLLVMAVVHTFWQKFMDGRALKSGRISAVDLKFEDVKPVSGGAAFRVVYAILPLLPIIVLLGFFAVNSAFGTSLGMGVELVTLISFFIAICCEAVRHRNGKEVLAGTENFFKGMGNGMGNAYRTQFSMKAEYVERLRIEAAHRLNPQQIEMIGDVLKEYGDKSAYHLEYLSHSEPPWKEARRGYDPSERSEVPISKETMKRYYQSLFST
jgi:hypothetical protein